MLLLESFWINSENSNRVLGDGKFRQFHTNYKLIEFALVGTMCLLQLEISFIGVVVRWIWLFSTKAMFFRVFSFLFPQKRSSSPLLWIWAIIMYLLFYSSSCSAAVDDARLRYYCCVILLIFTFCDYSDVVVESSVHKHALHTLQTKLNWAENEQTRNIKMVFKKFHSADQYMRPAGNCVRVTRHSRMGPTVGRVSVCVCRRRRLRREFVSAHEQRAHTVCMWVSAGVVNVNTCAPNRT